jgi:hypothetical protein
MTTTSVDPFPEPFIAWARYLSWADQHRKRLDQLFEQEGDSEPPGYTGRFITLTSQWFASLWVVIEGYRKLAIGDAIIDSLLSNPPGHSDLLRRCRNGVYHFQPDLLSRRLHEFLGAAKSAYAWAHALHFEFIRVFWHFPERLAMSYAQAGEWRSGVGEILGWLPDSDSLHVAVTQFENRCREYAALVPDDDMSREAVEVRASLQQLRNATDELRARLIREQQRYLDAGWLDTLPFGSV